MVAGAAVGDGELCGGVVRRRLEGETIAGPGRLEQRRFRGKGGGVPRPVKLKPVGQRVAFGVGRGFRREFQGGGLSPRKQVSQGGGGRLSDDRRLVGLRRGSRYGKYGARQRDNDCGDPRNPGNGV